MSTGLSEDQTSAYKDVMVRATDFYSFLYGNIVNIRDIEVKWKLAMSNSNISMDHVRRTASYLGINTITEKKLFWISKLALTAPMAPEWELTSSSNSIQRCNGKSQLCIHRIGLCAR